MVSRPSSHTDALEAWRQDLGGEAVRADADFLEHYAQSTCATKRHIVAVLMPGSLEDVQKIVTIANTHKVPLYPISCGKQWGMGSRLPVRDGAAIVDLGRMNRIIEVSAQYHYAVVEPGVTQKQLLDYIRAHRLPLMLNVTGSTSDTSLIGNAMDRGVGYFDSRAHGISSMQVVLGNGETIETGFGHYENARTRNLYRYGIGPSLDGLFPQGNFGIVTSACIDLMPMPDEHMAAIIKIDTEDKLPQLINALVRLRSRSVFQTVTHVGNRERSYITLAPLLYEQLVQAGEPAGEATRARAVRMLEKSGFGPWSAAIGILGTRAQLRLAKREIRRAMRGFAKTMFLNDSLIRKAKAAGSALSFIPAVHRQLMMLKAVEPVYGYTRGEATDKSIKSVFWPAGDYEHLNELNPDHSHSGTLYCLPIIPADGDTVLDVTRDTCATFERYGFKAAITVNLMDTKAMEGVVSLAFDRREAAQAEEAHACIQEMEARYLEQGYPPYRVGINSMHRIIHEGDAFWKTVCRLKDVLDPNHIIAPGRYNSV
jgi:4-cresol dehydrogenase (hydroxylating)